MGDFFTVENRNKPHEMDDMEFALTEHGQVIILDKCGGYTYSQDTYPSMVPPLSKQEFTEYILAIKKLDEGIDKINTVMDEVCQESIYYPPTLKEELLKLLTNLFHDKKTEWIYYYTCELNYGLDWTEKSVLEDGVPIPLKTPEDLYNLLVGNMKREYK